MRTAKATLTQAANQVRCEAGAKRACREPGQPCLPVAVEEKNAHFCNWGTQKCEDNGKWSACTGQSVPKPDVPGSGIDSNCDGEFTEALAPTCPGAQVWSEVHGECRCANLCSVGQLDPTTCSCTSTNQCGDGACSVGESALSCPSDCGSCGDGICSYSESAFSCASDCGYCGDAVCAFNESATTCQTDCGYCGDGFCAADEHGRCGADCGGGSTVCICGIDCPPGECDEAPPCEDLDDPYWHTRSFEQYFALCGAAF